MAKLEKLTKEQANLIPIVRDEWINFCLGGDDSINRKMAMEGIRWMYGKAKLQNPFVIFVNGPMACQYAVWFIKAMIKNKKFMTQVRDQVWDQVGDQVRAQVGDQVRDQVRAAFFSQHEAGWLAWASYFHKVCGLPGTEKIEPLARIAANCGWVWFFAGAAVITDRPRTLKRDDQNRLHCETGPAIEYRDGFAVHAWHGTRIPAEWIDDKAHLTAKIALTWPNIEQRRVAVEIVGWARILRELKARVIDADGDPQIGTLVEVKLPDLSRPARFCRVTCGTGREFAVGVPPEIDTALAAQAWMQGVPLADFIKPEIRT